MEVSICWVVLFLFSEHIFQVHILNTLGFDICHPTPIHFLRRFSKAARSDSECHTLAKYLTELAAVQVVQKHNVRREKLTAYSMILCGSLPLCWQQRQCSCRA